MQNRMPPVYNSFKHLLLGWATQINATCPIYLAKCREPFADVPSGNIVKGLLDPLNQCLEARMGSVRVNKLKRNPDKREMLAVGPNSSLENDQCSLWLDAPWRPNYSGWGAAGHSVAGGCPGDTGGQRGAFGVFSMMYQLGLTLEMRALGTIIHAMITSSINYVGLPLKIVRKLQLVQNVIAHSGRQLERSLLSYWNSTGFHLVFTPNSKCWLWPSKRLYGLRSRHLLEKMLCHVTAQPQNHRAKGFSGSCHRLKPGWWVPEQNFLSRGTTTVEFLPPGRQVWFSPCLLSEGMCKTTFNVFPL